METSEKRRRKLLEQTRALYSDKGKIPAVHPRYGAAYHRIYEQEEAAMPKGTFGIRLASLLLFIYLFCVSGPPGTGGDGCKQRPDSGGQLHRI